MGIIKGKSVHAHGYTAIAEMRGKNSDMLMDFGVLRMIVDKPEKTLEVLKNSGFTAKITPVIAIYVEDRPGGLYNVIKELSDAGISIEYVYAFTGRSEKSEAGVVVKVEHVENWSEEDFKTLKVKLLSREDIANLFE